MGNPPRGCEDFSVRLIHRQERQEREENDFFSFFAILAIFAVNNPG
jgi:hypothetical protein